MFALILLFFSALTFGQPAEYVIKSLRAFPANNELGLPIIFLRNNKASKIKIDFDVHSDRYPQLAIVFRFCDERWQPYNNGFLQNFGKDISTDLKFDKLPVTVTQADYHFSGEYPNAEVSFPFSGKWKYFVTSLYDTSRIFAEGYFFVIKSLLNINSKISKTTIENSSSINSERDRAFEIKTSFTLPDTLEPQRIRFVEIITNHNVFNPLLIKRTTAFNRFFEWNGTNKFSFVIKDILPGNEYRTIDFRNSKRFHKGNIYDYFNFPRTSRFYEPGKADLNGAEILTPFNNNYADYYEVPFLLRTPANFNKRVFLVGSFNNWQIDPSFEMKNNNGLFAKVIPLKRGRYDFQFVTTTDTSYYPSNTDWIELEGNFWQTTNDYYIFVHYYSPFNGGYDKIIGFSKIKSTGNWND